MWLWHVVRIKVQMFMDITGIDLFDEIVGMECAKHRLRCLWILFVLYLFDLK